MWNVGRVGSSYSRNKQAKRKKVESSNYQFQSSSSSSSLLFWTEAGGDLVSGFITTPNPLVCPRRSSSSSRSEVCAAGLSGIGYSVCVGDIEATNGFVDIDTPTTGDTVGADHAVSRDWDTSANNTDARFWLFVKASVRCSSSHFFPTVPSTHEGVPDGRVPSPGIDDIGNTGDFPSRCRA